MRHHSSFTGCSGAIAVSLTLGVAFAQTVPNGNFDSGTFPSGGNDSLNFTAGSTVTLGGAGKAAFFDTSNTGNVPTSWALASPVNNYGFWLNNTGTPQSPNRYVWLGGNENCQQNSVGGLTGGQTYRLSVSLAGWTGTLSDTTRSKSWSITQNSAALEVVTAGGISATTDASSSLVGSVVAQSGTTYVEFSPTVSSSANSLTWKTASVLVTLPAAVTSFTFYLSPVVPGSEGGGYNSSNGFFADSVTLASVPEASTLGAAVAVAGFSAFGLFRGRRTADVKSQSGRFEVGAPR
jgi:hypothetical protein